MRRGTAARHGRGGVSRTLGRIVSTVALLGAGAFGVARTPPAIDGSIQRMRWALRVWREDEFAALARYRRPEYVEALRRILETIPEDEPYLLVEAGAGHDDYFVRFDLAPRPAILLGNLADRDSDAAFRRPPRNAPRYVVLARLDKPWPECVPTLAFFAEAARR